MSLAPSTLCCFNYKYKLTPDECKAINDFDISNTVAHFTYMNLLYECVNYYFFFPSLRAGSCTLYNILVEPG